jgi:hypothetical protein
VSDAGREPARTTCCSPTAAAHLRSVRADDAPRIEAFHRALSLETIHFATSRDSRCCRS